MAYKIKSPLPVEEGGTENKSFTADNVICGGTTTTGPLQVVGDTGDTFEALTSQGAGSLPSWAVLSQATFFDPLGSDPSSPTVGQVWYRTDTGDFKGAIAGAMADSWTVKGNLNTARQLLAGSGDTDDALSYGGAVGGNSAVTERYNLGTNTWTAKTNLNTARSGLSGCGTDAADVLSFGGFTTVVVNTTELYEGSGDTWTAKTGFSSGAQNLNGGGSASDALVFGGLISGFHTPATELFNGTSWSTKANMNTGRSKGAGTGLESADCLSIGGDDGVTGSTTTVERYDGSANTWSYKASHNTQRSEFAASGPAQTAVTQCGRAAGGSLYNTTSAQYDGTSNSWSALSATNVGRDFHGSDAGPGSSNISLICGGVNGGGVLNSTEILGGGSGVTIVTFTVS